MNKHKKDINKIIDHSLKNAVPDDGVIKALTTKTFPDGDKIIVAIGKAAYRMAETASRTIQYDRGIIISKYGHSGKAIDNFEIYEAGHPLLDENTVRATERVLELTKDLKENDTVIFLVSGGGSALFEKPLIDLQELIGINDKLLKSRADINEINTVRKHLSKVKGGRFALHCAPARIYQIILSDVLGNRLDVIASGPSHPDMSSSDDAFKIIEKYQLKLSPEAERAMKAETPKSLDNVETIITSSVRELCDAARKCAESLGYETEILTYEEEGIAKETGKRLALKAVEMAESSGKPHCLIMGGETRVEVKGKGKGGRNQELALSASGYIKDKDILIMSLGSDGTDGPTDAAGAIVDGDSYEKLKDAGIDIDEVLTDNDSYEALKKIDALIFTGPTGTNVNDLMVALIN